MGLPFVVGQLLVAAILHLPAESAMPKPEAGKAPFSYEGLDRVIHEKAGSAC